MPVNSGSQTKKRPSAEVREFIAAEMTDEIRSNWLGGLVDTRSDRRS
jgi:hypothetical protein